jgi:hypothetical protein
MRTYKTTICKKENQNVNIKEYLTLMFLPYRGQGGDYGPEEIPIPWTEDQTVKETYLKDFVEKQKDLTREQRFGNPHFIFASFAVYRTVICTFEGKEITLVDNKGTTEKTKYIFDTIEENKKRYKIVPAKDLGSHITFEDYCYPEEFIQLSENEPSRPVLIYGYNSKYIDIVAWKDFDKLVHVSELK